MPDISMCTNDNCPNRSKCFRFMAQPTPGRQSYSGHTVKEGEEKCDSFYPLDNIDKSRLNKDKL